MTLTDAANDLFQYNLKQVARKFGLLEEDLPPLSIKEVTEILNEAENYSFSPTNEDRLLSLILCAMIWENRNDDWLALKPFIGRILIRLGLGTSAKMVNWSTEYNLFNSLGSLVEDLVSTVKLIDHQVIIRGHTIILSDFQKRMWDAIDESARLGISAPTSAGKSFVLVNKVVDTLSKENGKVVFVVPTISLITQVCNDLRKKIKEYGINDIYVSQTVNDVSLFKSDKIVYVLTQERAASALNHPDADFSNIKLLIVDEIQNIEKVANEEDERSQILLDVIQTFKNDLNPEKIILSGPRLQNIAELVKDWFGDKGRSVTESLPSVINITYSFSPVKKKLYFQQFIIPGIKHSIEIADNFKLKEKIISKVKYLDDANNFIASVISRNKLDGNIIFSDTTANANTIALAVASRLDKSNLSDKLDSIKAFIESTVHPKYSLIEAVDKGVAYHHSRMPSHIRCLVEKLFSCKHLNTIVSTTTLMQGVNLPAKNIIIRNPKVGDEKLTGYEFTNLKGRAGRLMEDFVGRALIIDEKQCNDASIDLSVAQQKNLNMGFGGRYQKDKALIDSVLQKNVEPDLNNNNDLITYIRNMCLRYGIHALIRIREVGITIDEALYKSTLENVTKLEVPRSICMANFYWDPLVLNRLYKSIASGGWPLFPSNIVDCAAALRLLITKMYTEAPYYYLRYLGNIDPNTEYGVKKIFSLSIYAENYGRGKSLNDVINPSNFPIKESKDIDDRIGDLHTKVVFGIPKLLRPIFNISDALNEHAYSQLLSFIEIGAVDHKLRALIEIGIPRETAINLLQNISSINFLDGENRINDSALSAFIKAAKNSPGISEWHKLLIQEIQ
jgi:hypothetical protein